jgi:hypothetical protein
VVLWNTGYISAALEVLRAQGYPVLDQDVARLSPFVREHVNVVGKYNFLLLDLGEGIICPSCATPTPPTTSCPTEPRGSVAACDG